MRDTLSRSILTLVAMLAVSAFAPIVRAQPGFGDDPIATVRAVARDSSVAPGATSVIAVVLDHEEGWHSYPPRELMDGPEGIVSFLISTSVEPTLPAGVASGAMRWPEPKMYPVGAALGGDGSEEITVYEGEAVILVPIRIADDAEIGSELGFEFLVTAQSCDDSVCRMPEDYQASLTLTVGEATAAAEDSAALFAGVDQAWIDEALGASTDAPAGASGSRSWFGIEIGSLGIVGLALGGILGGLVLNLTPCVLPVIPIKVMTLSQHAGENRMRAFSLGLWMAIGVVAFWVGIGLPVAFAAGFTDPSMIFGIWWVTAGIGVIIAAMGVGIMGAFQINLPQKVYMVNPKADSPQGSFVFGVMTAILGLPCFGFVAGALLAGAATMPTGQIMTVFASIGVGMASPYLVLSVFPKLLNFIPRTGPASELVKQIMGLLLLAAAAYFIGSGAIGLAGEIKGDVSLLPWWGKMLHWWAVAGFALAAGIWLVARTIKITPKAPARLGAAVLALIVSGSATAYVAGATIDARNNFWVPFSEESLADARADGKTVVIDFTAEWCLNCKALKKAVLNVDPVKSMLRSDDVVAMTADLTSSKAPGWQKMADLGQTGIPLLVIYGPGGEPWQSNAYTSDQVRSALAATGGETRVSAR